MQLKFLPGATLVLAVALALVPGAPAGAAPAHRPAVQGTLADARAEARRVRETVDRMQTEIAELTEDYNANAEARDRAIAADLAGRRHLEEADAAVADAQAQMDQRARAAYQRGPIAGIEGFLHARDWHEMLEVSAAIGAAARSDRATVDTLTRARTDSAATSERLAADSAGRSRLDRQLAAKRAAIQQRVDTLTSYQAQVDARVADLVERERRRQEAARAAAIARLLAAGGGNVSSGGWQIGGSPAPVTPATQAQAQQAVSWAMAQIGKPYQWGAQGPGRFDCSGLTSFAYAAAGLAIPRVSRAQFAAFASAARVALGDLRPGDLVFFASDPADPGTIHHVGMYVGRGLMVEAPHTGATVRLSSVMRPSFAGAVRPAAA